MDYNSIMAPGLYNTAYNPYALSFGQAQTPTNTTSAMSFAGQPQSDMFVGSQPQESTGMSTGAKVGLGAAAVAIASALIFKKPRTAIFKALGIGSKAAAEGGAKGAEQGLSGAARSQAIAKYGTQEHKIVADILREQRNTGFNDGLAKILKDHNVDQADLFKALKKAKTPQQAKEIVENAINLGDKKLSQEALAKLGNTDMTIFDNWLNSTVNYNTYVADFAKLAEVPEKVAKGLAARTKAYDAIKDSIESLPKATKDQIYALADEGNLSDIQRILSKNDINTQKGLSEWVTKSKNYKNYQNLAKKAEGLVTTNTTAIAQANQNFETYYNAIKDNPTAVSLFKQELAKSQDIVEAFKAAKGGYNTNTVPGLLNTDYTPANVNLNV